MLKLIPLIAYFICSVTLLTAQDSLNISNQGNFTDSRDEQSYKWVQIGSQIWMAENLNYRLNSNCICYKRLKVNCDTYGRLYKWKDAQSSCPTGWHLPDTKDWALLIEHLGGEIIAGGRIKETGTLHWNTPNIGATNSSEFCALPGGVLTFSDVFEGLGSYALLWTADKKDSDYSYYQVVSYNKTAIELKSYHIKGQLSVRCVKD